MFDQFRLQHSCRALSRVALLCNTVPCGGKRRHASPRAVLHACAPGPTLPPRSTGATAVWSIPCRCAAWPCRSSCCNVARCAATLRVAARLGAAFLVATPHPSARHRATCYSMLHRRAPARSTSLATYSWAPLESPLEYRMSTTGRRTSTTAARAGRSRRTLRQRARGPSRTARAAAPRVSVAPCHAHAPRAASVLRRAPRASLSRSCGRE